MSRERKSFPPLFFPGHESDLHSMIGKTISRYEITRYLGKGGCGRVYAAKVVGEADREEVAMKLALETRHNCAIRSEFRVYEYLKSKGGCQGIPNVQDFGEHNSLAFFTLDLLGPSLQSMKPESISDSKICDIAIQILGVLEFIHKCGIVHRDLYVGNVVFGTGDRKDTVFLIDFGMSRNFKRGIVGAENNSAEQQDLATGAHDENVTYVPYKEEVWGDIEKVVNVVEGLLYKRAQLIDSKSSWEYQAANEVASASTPTKRINDINRQFRQIVRTYGMVHCDHGIMDPNYEELKGLFELATSKNT